MKLTIRPERREEYESIDQLVLDSFAKGTDYSDGAEELDVIAEIRAKEYYLPKLSFVAEADGKTVGHFMLSKFYLKDQKQEGLLLLAPVAVDYRYLHQGIGKEMLKLGFQEAVKYGYKGIVVEGNPDFYHKVGFRSASEFEIYPSKYVQLPSPECLMAMELVPEGLSDIHGEVAYEMYETLSGFNFYFEAIHVMEELYGKDVPMTIATVKGDAPNIRVIDFYFAHGKFYATSYRLSNKVKEIEKNPKVALNHNLFVGHGTARNIGNPRKKENLSIREELRQAFYTFYDKHVNEEDENTCILEVTLQDAVVFANDYKYCIDFEKRHAARENFVVDIIF